MRHLLAAALITLAALTAPGVAAADVVTDWDRTMMRTRGKALTLRGVLLVAVAVAVAVALLAASTAGASGSGGRFNPPKGYYLSLGDSMGFGLQLDKLSALLAAGTYTPDAFNTGYTDDFATQMRQIRPDQQVVNLSCPLETTGTMISSGCPFKKLRALHTDYTGPQLDAAIAFLKADPGKISPITVSIGFNDVRGVLPNCNFDPTCIAQSGVKQHLAQNLDHILGALRAAAPNTEIIVLALYNPFKTSDPSTDQAWNQDYVQVESDAAARSRAFFANGFDAISTTDQLCQLTFLCTSGDLHPTDSGYQVLANLIDTVSGYNRLTQN
jgi:lysophospholipase L1-like esterase